MDTASLVRATCKKWPAAGNRTLARLLVEQHPHAFKNVEAARSAVRAARGARGEAKRKQGDKSAHQPLRGHGTITIPPGIRQARPPLRITTPGQWLVCGDLHVPYHDERAVETMLRYARKRRIPNVYINGDLLDFYQLSRFSKDPRFRSPHEEIETGIEVLREFKKHFRGERFFKKGNHEDRFERYLYERAPALVGIEAFELDRVMEVRELGFLSVQSRQRANLGKLPLFHGHEVPGGSAVNAARGVYMHVREGAAVNHWHRTSNHIENTGITKKIVACWSIGCLCELSPEYALANKWNHGFAVVTVADGGRYQFENKLIEGGEVYDA